MTSEPKVTAKPVMPGIYVVIIPFHPLQSSVLIFLQQ